MNVTSAFFGFLLIFLFCQNIAASSQVKPAKPLRVGVAGLVHGHVGWVFESNKRGDIEIVGIAEPDTELSQRYIKKYNLPASLIFSDLNEMLTKTKPAA